MTSPTCSLPCFIRRQITEFFTLELFTLFLHSLPWHAQGALAPNTILKSKVLRLFDDSIHGAGEGVEGQGWRGRGWRGRGLEGQEAEGKRRLGGARREGRGA